MGLAVVRQRITEPQAVEFKTIFRATLAALTSTSRRIARLANGQHSENLPIDLDPEGPRYWSHAVQVPALTAAALTNNV
jgi:hypothetical protein